MGYAIRKASIILGAAMAIISASSWAAAPIKVTLLDNALQLDTATAKAGKVTFEVTNAATNKMMHEMVVIKTDLAEGQLPVKGSRVKEGKLENLGEAADMKPGQTKKLTLTLSAGHYVLLCNMPKHYAAGMRAGFTVEP